MSINIKILCDNHMVNTNNNYINKIKTDVLKFGTYNRIACNYEEAYDIVMKRHLLPGEPCVIRYYETVEETKVVKALLAVGSGLDQKDRELIPIIVTTDINDAAHIDIDGKTYTSIQDAFNAIDNSIKAKTQVKIDGNTYNTAQEATNVILNKLAAQNKVKIEGKTYTIQDAVTYLNNKQGGAEPIPQEDVEELIDEYLK